MLPILLFGAAALLLLLPKAKPPTSGPTPNFGAGGGSGGAGTTVASAGLGALAALGPAALSALGIGGTTAAATTVAGGSAAVASSVTATATGVAVPTATGGATSGATAATAAGVGAGAIAGLVVGAAVTVAVIVGFVAGAIAVFVRDAAMLALGQQGRADQLAREALQVLANASGGRLMMAPFGAPAVQVNATGWSRAAIQAWVDSYVARANKLWRRRAMLEATSFGGGTSYDAQVDWYARRNWWTTAQSTRLQFFDGSPAGGSAIGGLSGSAAAWAVALESDRRGFTAGGPHAHLSVAESLDRWPLDAIAFAAVNADNAAWFRIPRDTAGDTRRAAFVDGETGLRVEASE